MFCRTPRRSALAAALSCPFFTVLPSLTQAQTPTLPPVVVTASRLPQPLPDALPHTTVLTARDIESSGVVDLLSLLKREAGMEFTQNGGMGSTSSAYMRGMEARHLLVLVDGLRLNSETLGQTALDQILLDQIERVEIVRGNVSALYGSGAIGGVVQIFTKGGSGGTGRTLSAQAGSRGTRALAAGFADKVGAWSYGVQAAGFRTDGFSSVDTRIFNQDNPDRDGFSNQSLSGRLAFSAAKDHTYGLMFYGTKGETEFDNGGNFGLPTDVHEASNRLTSMSFFAKDRLASNWTSDLQLSTSRDHGESTMNGGFYGAFDTRHRQAQWRNAIELAPTHRLTFVAEADRQSIISDSGFGPPLLRARTVSGISAGYVGKSGAHEWQANVRRDRAQEFGSANTGLLGYGYALTPGVKWIVLGSTAFTAPNLGQLYSPGFGNPDLRPERARSLETGVSLTRGENVLRITVFKTRVRDQIGFDLSSFAYRNDERVRNKGMEVSYSGHIGVVDLRASLTHQDPEDERTGERLRRRASTFGSVSASTAWKAWSFGLDVSSSAHRPDGAVVLGGYTVLDLRADYKLAKQWTLRTKLENALDKRYQTVHGYQQAPRGVFVTLAWQAE